LAALPGAAAPPPVGVPPSPALVDSELPAAPSPPAVALLVALGSPLVDSLLELVVDVEITLTRVFLSAALSAPWLSGGVISGLERGIASVTFAEEPQPASASSTARQPSSATGLRRSRLRLSARPGPFGVRTSGSR
jgi:hypothetical protein